MHFVKYYTELKMCAHTRTHIHIHINKQDKINNPTTSDTYRNTFIMSNTLRD